jgi:anaerobic magnesium-protoporphyrin IX monomethyl ester cyclase
MRLLLIQPPDIGFDVSGLYPKGYSKQARSILPPLGLLSLAAYLKERHVVYVLDMPILGQTVDDIPEALEKLRPDVVGITAVIDLWPSVLDTVREVKDYNPSIRTVIGGANATAYPEETLCHPEVDYVIVGNGQKPLMNLCNVLEVGWSGRRIENCYVQGVDYDKFDCVHSGDHHIGNFPYPDRYFTPTWEYTAPFCPENPSTTMITSMGCPYRCTFCTQRRPPIQFCRVDAVIDEMEEIQNLGIRSILFQDELFTFRKDRVGRICEGLIERRVHLHWTVKSRVDTVRPWMLALMKKAGCFNVHFGFESGNDDTLKRMRKGYTREQIVDTVKMVRDAGLSCTGNFMLAYPGESERDILDNIAFAKSLNLDLAQFSITGDTPGAPLFDEALRLGRRKKDFWSDFTAHSDPANSSIPLERWSASDRFTREQLFSFLERAYAETRTLYDVTGQTYPA